MNTKSETTKRIEKIIKGSWMQVDGFTVSEYDKMVKELATKIATHLYQEVIRGKIEELKRFAPDKHIKVEDYCSRITDLERQIKD